MSNRARHLSDWVQEGDHAEFSPPFGAGVIFDAERLHAVAPISEGQRLVLVVEFCESIGLAVVPALYISRASMPTAYPHRLIIHLHTTHRPSRAISGCVDGLSSEGQGLQA